MNVLQVQSWDFTKEKTLPPSFLRDELDKLRSAKNKEADKLAAGLADVKAATDADTSAVSNDIKILLDNLSEAYGLNVRNVVDSYFDAVSQLK